jgi:protein TonB
MTTCELTEPARQTGRAASFSSPKAVVAAIARAPIFDRPETNSMPAVLTCVLWTSCLAVGIVGALLPYTRPHAPRPEPPPLIAQKLEVQLSADPVVAAPLPPPDPNAAPPPPDAVAQPQVAPVAVAMPSPTIAFAVPVEGPVRVVTAKQAAYTPPPVVAPTPAAPSLVPQALVYGRGEGTQPAPDYPDRAKREGQEGVVTVTLVVGENGRVESAQATQPSPWQLLNDSAVRTVRSRWRFQPGERRAYEVPIRFALTPKKG